MAQKNTAGSIKDIFTSRKERKEQTGRVEDENQGYKNQRETNKSMCSKNTCSKTCHDFESRLGQIELQNQEILSKYDFIKSQNSKIIAQNETLREMLETQLKLLVAQQANGPALRGQGSARPLSKASEARGVMRGPMGVSNPTYTPQRREVQGIRGEVQGSREETEGSREGEQRSRGEAEGRRRVQAPSGVVWQVAPPPPRAAVHSWNLTAFFFAKVQKQYFKKVICGLI